MSVTRELALRERIEELEQKIATRNALIKSQAECIERLRGVLRQADQTEKDVRSMRKTAIVDDDFPFQLKRADTSTNLLRQHLNALHLGDMGEPTNE